MTERVPRPSDFIPANLDDWCVDTWREDYYAEHPEDGASMSYDGAGKVWEAFKGPAPEGTFSWTRNNVAHREGDRPAVIEEVGRDIILHWARDGVPWRANDKPAKIKIDRDYYTYVWLDADSKEHRDGDLPAVISDNGFLAWRRHGNNYRAGDNPAVVNRGTMHWYDEQNRIHRDNGPAAVYPSGASHYYDHGLLFDSREEWQKAKWAKGLKSVEVWPRGIADVVDRIRAIGDVNWSWGRCLQELRIQRRGDQVLRAFQAIREQLPLHTDALLLALRDAVGSNLDIEVETQDKFSKYTLRERGDEGAFISVRRTPAFDRVLENIDRGLVFDMDVKQFHFDRNDTVAHARVDMNFPFMFKYGDPIQRGWLIEEIQSDWLQHAHKIWAGRPREDHLVGLVRRLWEHLPEVVLRLLVGQAKQQGVETVLMTTAAIQRQRWKGFIKGPAPMIDSIYKSLPKKLGFTLMSISKFPADDETSDVELWVFDTSQRLRRVHASIRGTIAVGTFK